MRRRVLIAVLVAAGIVATAAVTVADADPGGDSVVGGGRDAVEANISVSAHSGPNGENPRGHAIATLPRPREPGAFKIRLRVVCMATMGGLASVGGVVTESAAPDVPTGAPVVVVYRDTGLPGGAGDAVEPFPFSPALACADFVGLAATAPPLRNGNVSIVDT